VPAQPATPPGSTHPVPDGPTPTNGSPVLGPRSSAPGRTVLDEHDISRALTRIAHEILERNKGAADLVLLGIPSRGVPLAKRIAAKMASAEGVDVPVGSLDVTMYRDDLRMRPARTLLPTEIPPGGLDGKVVVLVDDVLFSGRTIRAALDAMTDVGRPHRVRLAVLVDRGHRDLPIRADFVGKNLPTSLAEKVSVRLVEFDGHDGVTISGPASTGPDLPDLSTGPTGTAGAR
jgi:pyrimidine operon attenuation protein / uracil phosphoribosyltransferase